MRRVMLKEIISAVKLSLFPIWCWPMSKNTTRFKMSCMKLYHCWCVIMAMCLAASLLYGILNHIDEPAYLGQQLFLLSSCFHISSNFIFYQINYHHIQVGNIYLFIIKKFRFKLAKESRFTTMFSINNNTIIYRVLLTNWKIFAI